MSLTNVSMTVNGKAMRFDGGQPLTILTDDAGGGAHGRVRRSGDPIGDDPVRPEQARRGVEG